MQYIFHIKKVLPRTYRVYGNGTSSSYSYEKGTPQDIGSKETVHPVHISYKKGTAQDIGSKETVQY